MSPTKATPAGSRRKGVQWSCGTSPEQSCSIGKVVSNNDVVLCHVTSCDLQGTFPKLQMEINILVVENGGNALGAALLSASMALATCGVKMLDLPVASSVVHYGSSCLVDPSLDEEERARDGVGGAKGHVTVVYLSSLDEVTSIRQTGCMLPGDLMMAVDAGIESCLRLKHRMKCILCT
jgi:ribonuclease PH